MKNKIVITLVSIMILSSMILMPAQNVSAYLGDRTLNEGMAGYDVMQLQRNLGYLGYKVGSVDGVYGGKTTEAVKAFQANNEMNISGEVNKDTANVIINQVSYTSDEPKTATISATSDKGLSKQELYDLARVVHGEARGEPFTGQVAVAAVVLNRVESGNFGNSIKEVIYEPGAFTAVADGQYYLEPDSSAFKAVEAAIQGWDPTGGAIYYWNPQTATSKWVWSRPIINQIGKHVFAI